jgi:hypothetical protein
VGQCHHILLWINWWLHIHELNVIQFEHHCGYELIYGLLVQVEALIFRILRGTGLREMLSRRLTRARVQGMFSTHNLTGERTEDGRGIFV